MRVFLSRLAEFLYRRSREERLSSEIDLHVEMLAEDLQRGGMTRDEARLAARREFGGVDRTRILHREQRGLPMLEALLQDVVFALRVLRRDRGFALTAILVLGVGLGVNNLFFTLVYAHKFRGVSVHDVDRVLSISTFDDRGANRLVSWPEFEDIRAAQSTFTAIAAYSIGIATVGDEGRAPDRFNAAYVTANAFPLLGLAPSAGRLPSTDDDRPGNEAVVLLGQDVWRQRYDTDPQILGRTVIVNGSPATVIGIVPERSGFPSMASVWLPMGRSAEVTAGRSVRRLNVVGRLRDDVDAQAARSEVEAMFGRFETEHPDTNRHVRARVVGLNERLLGSLDGWWQFITAGVIVILIACANAANLMMARALHRAPEIAIRTSLGASRARIVGQLLIEALVLSGGAAILGAVLSVAGSRAVESGVPEGILPYWTDYDMDRGVFGLLIAVALATVVVFGLIPAIQASRTDVNRTLKDGGRAIGSQRLGVLTGGFLSVELALAMILLGQVAIASYVANRPLPTDANINTTAIVTASVTLPPATYPDALQRQAFFARFEQRLRSRPEVVSTSLSTLLPGDGGFIQRRLQIRGREQQPGDQPLSVLTIDIAPHYFDTLAIGMLKGRDFTAVDDSAPGGVAIVNERFAQVFLDGLDAIGTQLSVTAPSAATPQPQWATVIGVVPNVRQQGFGGVGRETPVVYVPIAATAPATASLMVRHRVDAENAAAVLRAEAQAVDPGIALYQMRTLERAVRDAQWNRHMSAVLADVVTWMSVLLATVGLYAVTAQRVSLKTREIGLRMALGARSMQIAKLIVGGLRVPLLTGLLLGTLGAMAWDGAFSSGVAGVYTAAPSALIKTAGFITILVMASCVIPLRRAVATNPITALRQD